PRPYLCLFDSLALLYFLARYEVFPQWVFAVQLKPFRAHCWVQSNSLVVNDVVANVRHYTPIMSI
ncbi:MAG: lasso peptide biosynthesis B2 protein, partial [Pseudomonadota bacterium]